MKRNDVSLYDSLFLERKERKYNLKHRARKKDYSVISFAIVQPESETLYAAFARTQLRIPSEFWRYPQRRRTIAENV